MKIVVISSQSEYDKFKNSVSDAGEYQVFSDNPKLYSDLKSRFKNFEPLTQFVIQDQWSAINGWGCDRASKWLEVCQKYKLFPDFDIASLTHHNFSYLLVHLLKNYFFAKYIVTNFNPTEVTVFDYGIKPQFPKFISNLFLGHFLSDFFKSSQIKTITIENLAPNSAQKDFSFKRLGRQFIQSLHGMLNPIGNEIEVFTVGSTRHLSPVFSELKNREIKTLLYDFEFHLDKYLECQKRGIKYATPDSFPKENCINREEFIEGQTSGFLESIKISGKEKLFTFDGIDFGPYLVNYFQTETYLSDYAEELYEKAEHYQNIFNALKIKSILLDEEISTQNSLISAFFFAKNINVFALSHANFMVDFSVSEQGKTYGLATTFVHSEFEKLGYTSRGWNPDKMIVTGTPKYDHLALQERLHNPRMNVFFCGASLFRLLSPDRGGYLAHTLSCTREIQEPSLKAVFEAIKGMPIDLTFKSRSVDESAEWKEFLKNSHIENHVVLESPKEDFFKLLRNSDLMVLCYWSTAIVEAAICKKPVILIDVTGALRGLYTHPNIAPYFESGLCVIARNLDELRQHIQNYYQAFKEGKEVCVNLSPESEEYFLGKQDEQNTVRVVDYILNTLNASNSNTHFVSSRFPIHS